MSSQITLPNGNVYTLVSLPPYPGLVQVSFTHKDAVASVPSPFVPSQNQTQVWPGADGWGLSFTLPKMNRWTAAPWKGFLAGLRGTQNVFQIGDPFGTTPLGAADGAPVCNTTGTNNLTSATTLVTSGWTPNVFGQLFPGDYIQLGYHLHEVCEQVNSDADGNATIEIWPSLRDSPANASALVLTKCVGLFKLAKNERSWHADVVLAQMSFTCTEAR